MKLIIRLYIICGHHPPILAKLRPYYKNSIFRKYSEIDIPEVENSELPESVSILPMNVSDKSEKTIE